MLPNTKDTRVNAKRAGDSMARLAQMEQDIALMQKDVVTVADKHNELAQAFDEMKDVLTAAVRLLGPKEVREGLQAIQDERQVLDMERVRAQLAADVAAGKLVVGSKVEATDLVVVSVTLPDGTVKVPGRHTVQMATTEPELAAKLVGLELGGKAELDDKTALTVLEVYREPTFLDPASRSPTFPSTPKA